MTGAAALEARRLLRRGAAGMLATASSRFGGHPFGSALRYATDGSGRPLLLVSRLAEHSRNMQTDPRTSLLVVEPGAHAQADARVTVVGRCAPAPPGDPGAQRYLRRFPDAAGLLGLGDFSFLRIEPLAVRFIAGFGDIHWLTAQALLDGGEIAAAEPELLEGIDARRAAALWSRQAESAEGDVAACGIDCDGIELRCGTRLLRVDFPQPVANADAARAAVAALLRMSEA